MTARTRRILIFSTMVLVLAVGSLAFSMLDENDSATTVSDPATELVADAQPIDALGIQVVGDISGLDGDLIVLEQRGYPDHRLARIDFDTGAISTAYQVPPQALVYQVTDGGDNTLIMTYSTPLMTFAYNGIYRLDLTAENPQPEELLVASYDSYYAFPVVAPDGAIYAVTYNRGEQIRSIIRFVPESGSIETIVENATLPALSPDGSQLAYIRIDPETERRSLWLASSDGSDARELIAQDEYPDLDLPAFSSDGNSIIFAVLTDDPGASESAGLIEQLTGASTASAHGDHGIPAYWFRVMLADERVQQLTADDQQIMSVVVSSNSEILGFASNEGFRFADMEVMTESDLVLQSLALRTATWLAD